MKDVTEQAKEWAKDHPQFNFNGRVFANNIQIGDGLTQINTIDHPQDKRPEWLTDEFVDLYLGERELTFEEYDAFLQDNLDMLFDHQDEIIPKLLHWTGVWRLERIQLIKDYIKESNCFYSLITVIFIVTFDLPSA